ncbi:hypothetical protein FMEXI_7176 [Fusarium mexicanum]|uniref:Uncharacterized protein n=1 Tax=Fusarium mexicanum TaxID=751941 RepID=A0A8H5MWT8_9HYPO|nr:hypothetical protein FMEXI_7176 [Fusarium mexicanum]
MAGGLSNPSFSNERDHFISVMRIFDGREEEYVGDYIFFFPKWIEKYCDYSHTKHTQAGVHDLSDPNLEVQRKMGILINKVWTVEMKDPNHLAQYCAFKSIKELSSYVDVIVPDIVYHAAFVAHNYFLVPYSDFNNHGREFSQNFIEPLNSKFRECQRPDLSKGLMDIDCIDPLKVLIAYHNDEKVQEFTNNVAKLCTKPTFIPALNGLVMASPEPGAAALPSAFILAHAVQILLFAPQDWDPNRVYSRDQGAYTHRFPTPEAIGGGTMRTVAGLFSMEDLYRAVLLFYYLLKRRSASKWITKTAPTSSTNNEFPGYHNPTSASTERPQANEADAIAANNESDSDDPFEDVSESEGLDENEGGQPGEGNDESNQDDEDGDQSEQADGDEDDHQDAPESLIEAEAIEELKTISINTLILESLTTTRPSKSLSQRLRYLGKPESPPMSSDVLRSELWFLLEHHMLPDFGSEVSTSTKNDTHVPFDLGIPEMKHLINRPSGTSTNSEIDQLSPLVLVEECCYQWDTPHYPDIDDFGHVQPPGQKNHPISKSPEHRKAVLTSFDWRNKILLELEEPPFLATVDNARSAMKDLINPAIAEYEIEGFGSEEVTPLVDTYKMLGDDQTCGLRLVYDQAIAEKNRLAPTDRIDCIRWICYYNPIMTRALEVANNITVALFVVAGFNVGSIRSSDTGEEQAKIIKQWNNKASGLEILVANLDTKIRDINVHTDCAKGLLLNWTLVPERMLKIINNMSGTSQKGKSIFHMVKVADTYHDAIERVSCTNWAMQLSKDIKLPEWMTGVIREICIFELIKSTWHQEFNRYAWVVAHDLKGSDFKYHDPEWRQLGHVFSIVAKLVLHHPDDREFWIESMPVLVELCFHFNDAFDASDFLGHRLCLAPREMRESFLPIFKRIKSARAAVDDEQVSERREMLQRGVEARAGDHKTVARRGEKRKASDGGEGGAKKQKASAA